MNRLFTSLPNKMKHLIVGLFDMAAAVVAALILLPAFTQPAYAYVDPSVMTYTIQALAGVAVALSAVAGVAFRRSRKALMKALNIDENAKKEKDPTWQRLEADQSNLTLAATDLVEIAPQAALNKSSRPSAKKYDDAPQPLPWARRFAMAFIVSLFCGITLGVSAPIETVAGASGDLLFGVNDVALSLILFSVVCSALLACILSVLPRRIFSVVLTLVFCIGFCCYIQAMFLNEGLPAADGRPVDWWNEHQRLMELSLLVWIVLLVVPTVLSGMKPKQTTLVACALSAMLILVQGVGVTSLFLDANKADTSADPTSIKRDAVFGTETGLYDVSKKNNVIVFVLDMYDTRTLQTVLDQDPSLLDEMTGFTWYKNSVGPMLPTNFALPYLITGSEPAPGESLEQYNVSRYANSDYLATLHETGYFVGVYSPMLQLNYLDDELVTNKIFNNVDNFHPIQDSQVNTFGAIKSLVKVALYRDLPWVLKGRFRFYTDDLNQSALSKRDEASPDSTVYILDDGEYYRKLKTIGLSFESESYPGSFKLIHLNGAHFPYNIDEEGNDVGEGNSSKEAQAIGSMNMVSEYLRLLKEKGVYDSSTIIITADHGDWSASPELPTDVTSPIAIVKHAHADNAPLAVSDSPVSHADIFGTVYAAMGVLTDNNVTSYDDTFASDRVRSVYQIGVDDSAHIRNLFKYHVIGDVLDFSNWYFTGDKWYGNVVDY